ncbi:MAG: TonB family protein [Pyrinomonadaceae bacterium]
MRSNTSTLLAKHAGVASFLAMLLAIAILPAAFSLTARSQGNQLSLADILVALRSKKASLPDRNKILSDAVVTRGTTFSLTPEIEKELSVTGASKVLLDSIRHRSQIAKVSNVTPSTDAKPRVEDAKANAAAEPPPPAPLDLAAYEKRASDSAAKGDMDAAIIDYTKAIDMNPTAVASLLGRADCYLTKSLYILAIADLTKVIELDPTNAAAYAMRGQAHEKKFNAELALEDYKKAVELGTTDETAKAAVKAFRDKEQADAAAKLAATPVVLPEFVDVGWLNEAMAIRLVKPAFSAMAMQAGVSGQVVLDVELDTEGNVTKAKVVSGHQYLRMNSEEAARKSKFKPAMIDDKPVKAHGRLVYNFVPRK